MKIGGIVKIKKYNQIPEVIGEDAEIVDLQIQEFDKYAVYPVWVKMASGERKGKVYGFQYDEVEVVPKAYPEKTLKVKAIEQLEESLKAMKMGVTVKIKKCDSIPEVIGENAEIVDTQIQEFDKYAVYPVWVKMTSGERKGKVYGFQYDEVEMLPKVYEAQGVSHKKSQGTETVKTKVVEQLEEILRDITTVEDIAEVERVIDEVKGKVLAEPALGFWEGKTPCWEMFRCPEIMRNECPAFKHQDMPCWQIEGTYCKLLDYGTRGDGLEICGNCRVYKRWGHSEPIEIRLRGEGFSTATKAVSK